MTYPRLSAIEKEYGRYAESNQKSEVESTGELILSVNDFEPMKRQLAVGAVFGVLTRDLLVWAGLLRTTNWAKQVSN